MSIVGILCTFLLILGCHCSDLLSSLVGGGLLVVMSQEEEEKIMNYFSTWKMCVLWGCGWN